MSAERLIRMANQIAKAMAGRPEGQAEQDFAAHINDFWEPRMRAQLLGLLAAEPQSFESLATRAAPLIRPAPATASG